MKVYQSSLIAEIDIETPTADMHKVLYSILPDLILVVDLDKVKPFISATDFVSRLRIVCDNICMLYDRIQFPMGRTAKVRFVSARTIKEVMRLNMNTSDIISSVSNSDSSQISSHGVGCVEETLISYRRAVSRLDALIRLAL